MNSSLKGTESESNFFIRSFFESVSNFIKNVKIEIKDVFELLNYPCVYQNCKKKFSINENEDYKNSLATSVISKIDKKNIENFRHYQRELESMLQNVKLFNEKYKMDVPLLFIMENLITLHLINEYKINSIVKKIQDHNIAMPELNSDLPSYLIQAVEVDENENNNVLYDKVREIKSLSINNHVVKDLLENTDIRINFSKLRELNEERYFHSNVVKYISSYMNKSNDSVASKMEGDDEKTRDGWKAEEGGYGLDGKNMDDAIRDDIHNNVVQQKNEEQSNKNMSVCKMEEEKKSIIEDIGLSEETLKLLNLLPKKRKTDD
ncbi:conserved Plasmodium protein, unknown function [Plasmodium ovale]|uniref:Uncharacterized protein n=2 Tax=Plasmodium ovale TaxID=36330 RepID=A0A1A8W1E2_PLAOA|nr:conserved Plasmodium protein, unknown function [Plasmodium ovale curtisi]SBS96021.1 conserved Plasmodium protein, unknown function [Plasmodium ovale curtisi]SCP05278.1 conserved Plasmodium protein, unknown function [Plasmodium ovale]